jgi:hypothetical protein
MTITSTFQAGGLFPFFYGLVRPHVVSRRETKAACLVHDKGSPDMNITDTTATSKDRQPIADLLVRLGKVLLKSTHHTDWLDTDSLVEVCKANDLRFNDTQPTHTELESLLKEYFSAVEELYQEGVNVVGFPRRSGWDLVFMVRFDRYNPEHYRTPINLRPMSDGAAQPANLTTNTNN